MTLERIAAWTNTLPSRGLILTPVSALAQPPANPEPQGKDPGKDRQGMERQGIDRQAPDRLGFASRSRGDRPFGGRAPGDRPFGHR